MKKRSKNIITPEALAITNAVADYKLSHRADLLPTILKDLDVVIYFSRLASCISPIDSDVYNGSTKWGSVILNCYEGALWEKLSTSDTRALLVGAIFHGVEHTNGNYSDKYNAESSIERLRKWHKDVKETNKSHALTDEEYNVAVSCIRYAYRKENDYSKIKVSSTNKPERIIRDAYGMTPYEEPVNVLNLYKGLHFEMNNSSYNKPVVSINQFLEYLNSDLRLLPQQTSWAKLKAFHRNWPNACKNAILLLKDNSSNGEWD